jgi:hypothetical protein
VPRRLFDQHPEYFSLNHGRRTTRQLCTTNPAVVRIAARTLVGQMAKSPDWFFPAGPNDGGGLCQCATCCKLDTRDYLGPSSGLPNCSDRILDFGNRLAALTAKPSKTRAESYEK